MIQQTRKNEQHYTVDTALADLVQGDYRFASVLEHYGLNYCCKGAQSVAQACEENGLDANEVLTELGRLSPTREASAPRGSMDIEEVLDLLYRGYEPRLQAMLQEVETRLEKISASHGEDFPETIAVVGALKQLRDAMEHHTTRSKEVWLPKVREILELGSRTDSEQVRASISRLRHVTHQVIADTRLIQGYLFEIRELTSRYSVPEGVCMTFSVGYRELAALDETLSQYLEIEENLLVSRLLAETDD